MTNYNKSEIMKKAWEIKKNMESIINKTYNFSKALKRSWEIAKSKLNTVSEKISKTIEITTNIVVVKSWIAQKNLTQHEYSAAKSVNFECEVLKETAKAIYVSFKSKFGSVKMWCPKSQIV